MQTKGGGLVRSGDERDPTEGFRFVSDHQADYPIAAMCRLLGVSPCGHCAWRQPSRRAQSAAALIAQIRAPHEASRGTYGAPRVHLELSGKGLHFTRRLRSMSAVAAGRPRSVTSLRSWTQSRRWRYSTCAPRSRVPAPKSFCLIRSVRDDFVTSCYRSEPRARNSAGPGHAAWAAPCSAARTGVGPISSSPQLYYPWFGGQDFG